MSFELEDTFENWRRAKRSASLLAPPPTAPRKSLSDSSAQTSATRVSQSGTQTLQAEKSDSSSQTADTSVSSCSTQTDAPWISVSEREALAEAAEGAAALEILVRDKDLELRRLTSLLKRERRAARRAEAEVERLRVSLAAQMGNGESYADAALDVELCIEGAERLCAQETKTDALADALASERRRSDVLQQQLLEIQSLSAELRSRLGVAEAEVAEQRTVEGEALICRESLRETRQELESCREELRVVKEHLQDERHRSEETQKEAEAAHVHALTATAEMESALERCCSLETRCRSLEESKGIMESIYEDELQRREERVKQLEMENTEGAQQLQTVTNLVVLELAPLFLSLEPSEEFRGRELYSKLESSAASRNVSLLRDVVAISVKSIEQRIRRADATMDTVKQIVQKGAEEKVFSAFSSPSIDKIDAIESRISRLCLAFKRLSSMVHLKNEAISDAKEGCLVAERVIETLRDEKLRTEAHLEEAVRSRHALAKQVEILEEELEAEKEKAHASLKAAREAVSAAQRTQKRWQVEAFARSLDLEKERAKAVDPLVAPS